MNRNEMLKRIQMIDFAIKEANLFLDTHPTDAAALAYFDKYNKLCKQMKQEYEAMYGPLTVTGVNTENGWTWINSPWPWELEG